VADYQKGNVKQGHTMRAELENKSNAAFFLGYFLVCTCQRTVIGFCNPPASRWPNFVS